MENRGSILSLFGENEEVAFRLLYDRYYKSLCLLANQITRDPKAAEDIVQDLFIAFWIKKDKKQSDSRLENYLFQAIRYASYNYLRDNQRRAVINRKIADNTSPAEQPQFNHEAEEFEALYKAISQLPTERRRIFTMIFIEEMKYQEVADALGISLNTVKTQVLRSIKYLRNALGANNPALILFFKIFSEKTAHRCHHFCPC